MCKSEFRYLILVQLLTQLHVFVSCFCGKIRLIQISEVSELELRICTLRRFSATDSMFYICSLFNNAFSTTHNIQRRMKE
jgi:hypothetical protein